MRGIRVEDPGKVPAAISAALVHPGAIVIDAVVNRQELSMPPKIELAGFSLYILKAVMSGKGDSVLDLARTNLWR